MLLRRLGIEQWSVSRLVCFIQSTKSPPPETQGCMRPVSPSVYTCLHVLRTEEDTHAEYTQRELRGYSERSIHTRDDGGHVTVPGDIYRSSYTDNSYVLARKPTRYERGGKRRVREQDVYVHQKRQIKEEKDEYSSSSSSRRRVKPRCIRRCTPGINV